MGWLDVVEQISFETSLAPPDAHQQAQRVVAQLGWGVTSVGSGVLAASTNIRLSGAIVDLRMNIEIECQARDTTTKVALRGSTKNLSNKKLRTTMQAELGKFINAFSLAETATPQPVASTVGEEPSPAKAERIIELSHMLEKGAISRSEFETLKQSILGS